LLARNGINAAITFIACTALADFACWLISEDKSFGTVDTITAFKRGGNKGLFRIFINFLILILAPLLAAREYFSEEKLKRYISNGRDITIVFYVVWILVVISLGVYVIAALSASSYATFAPEFQMNVTVILPLTGIQYHGIYLGEHYGDEVFEEPGVGLEVYAPLAHETKNYILAAGLLMDIVLHRYYAQLMPFGPVQLAFKALVTVLVLLACILLVPGVLSPSLSIFVLICYLTLSIEPTRQLNAENYERTVELRLEYARVIEEARRSREMNYKLMESEQHLKDMRSKFQLSQEQAAMVKASMGDEMKGMSSFKVDMDADVVFSQKLGAGGFGIVYLATYRRETVAVKQLIAEKINDETLQRFKAEIVLLTQLHHPNICQIIAAAWEAPHLAIILEFAASGDLSVYLKKHAASCSWATRLKFLNHLSQGMRYLHNRSPPVIHRDLKTENCLITEFDVLKLSDFGESRKAVEFGEDGDENLTMVGTPYFIAPEVVRGDFYNESADVFSFAIVLASLGVADGETKCVFSEQMREGKALTGMQKTKLKGHFILNQHAKGWRSDISSFAWPEKMKELVRRAWGMSVEERPSFNEICDVVHDWTEAEFETMTIN
jgi:hypothetical protein